MEACINIICDIVIAISTATLAIIVGYTFVSSAIDNYRKRKAADKLAKILANKLKECKCRCEKE